MSNAGYQPPGGQGPNHRAPGPPGFQQVPPPRPPRPSSPALLPAILLIVAGTLMIISSFLTITQSTHRLLSPNTRFSGSDSRVAVTTSTAWSVTSTVPISHPSPQLAGWGLVLVGLIAMVAGALLLASRGRWAGANPLAALASGLLAGVVLRAVLDFAGQMSAAFADNKESIEISAGPAVLLLVPAGLLAVAVAALAMFSGRRSPAHGTAPPPSMPMPFPPNPEPGTYQATPQMPYPPWQQAPYPPPTAPPGA